MRHGETSTAGRPAATRNNPSLGESIPAAATPFRKDGTVDTDALELHLGSRCARPVGRLAVNMDVGEGCWPCVEASVREPFGCPQHRGGKPAGPRRRPRTRGPDQPCICINLESARREDTDGPPTIGQTPRG